MSYQGHLSGGNPVQRHSAGEHYPYVIAVVERDGGLVRWYEVTGPGTPALAFESDAAAVRVARRLATLINNEDAWAFEVEQAGYISQQRQPQVIATVADWAKVHLDGRVRYADLSAGERAMTLLWYGRARSSLRRAAFGAQVFADDLARAARRAADARLVAADPAALLPEKVLIPADHISVAEVLA